MSAQRMLFIFMACFIYAGIYLSGHSNVHWLLYLPVVMLLFAGITGVCPGMILFKKMGFK